MNKNYLFNRSAFSQAKGHGIKRKTKQGLIAGLTLAAAFTVLSKGQEVAAEDLANSGFPAEMLTSDYTSSDSSDEEPSNINADETNSSLSDTDQQENSEAAANSSQSTIKTDSTAADADAEKTDDSVSAATEETDKGLSADGETRKTDEIADTDTTEETVETAAIVISEDGAAADSDNVTIAANTITITHAGTYTISGTGDGYTITIDSAVTEAITLQLDNLELTNSNIYSNGDLTIIVLSDSSVSSALTNTIEAAGALYVTSKDKSSLTVSSSAKHAVKAASVTIDGAVLSLISAAKDGLHATTDVKLINSTVLITAGDDGIQIEDDTDVNAADLTVTDSVLTIEAADKGITAGDTVTIEGDAVLSITSGDEGIEGRYINLTGGTITINAGDDGINATEWTSKDSADLSNLTNSTADIEHEVAIRIDGAILSITAGGDALDSNGNLIISGGSVYLTQTSVDNSALDYDGTGLISGGTVWAIGSNGMAQAFTTGSNQAYIMTNISGSQGDTITITDSNGSIIAAATAETDFSNIVFSSENLTAGATYTVTTSSGRSASAAATTESSANGFGMGMGGPVMGDGTMPDNPPSFDGVRTAADGSIIFPDFSQIDRSEDPTAAPSDAVSPLLPREEADSSERDGSSAGDSAIAPLPSELAASDSDTASETTAPSASGSQSQIEEEEDSEGNTAEQTDKAETKKDTETAASSHADLNLETKAKQRKEQTKAEANFLKAKQTETAPAPYSNAGSVYRTNREDLQHSGRFLAFTAGNYREALSANSVPYPAFAYSDLSSNRYSRTDKQRGSFRTAAQTQPAVSQKLAVKFKTKTWDKSGQFI
ncbi:carbohydrate-binding domain-containing protein [Streptococcus sp. H49]|uniref:carbohydrate-binding domain-containing protein n=1 Tax=Streptococcus huangxiaojuni TaxID=3237239 RepID=UPI0034A230E3